MVGRSSSQLAAVVLAAVLVLAALSVLLGPPAWVTVDNIGALAQGRDLGSFKDTTFAGATTPHPLVIALATVLSPLGDDGAYDALTLLFGHLTFGTLLVATFLLVSRAAGSPLAGGVAGVLVATSTSVLYTVYASYLDPLFATLVLMAAWLELGRTRRGTPVLVLLVLAGLLRPEAWLLAGLYWLWLFPALDWSARARTVVLVVAAPVLWTLMDLVVMGEPFYSFTSTESAADVLYEQRGRLENLRLGTEQLRSYLPIPLLGVALLGAAIALFTRRRQMIVVAVIGLALAAVFVVFALVGLPTNDRYLLIPALVLCALVGVGASAWVGRDGGRARLVLAGLGALTLLVVVAHVVRQRDPLQRVDAVMTENRDGIQSVQAFSQRPDVRRAVQRCRSFSAPAFRARRYFAYYLDLPPDAWRLEGSPGTESDAYFAPTAGNLRIARLFTIRQGTDATPITRIPPGYRPAVRDASWTLHTVPGRC